MGVSGLNSGLLACVAAASLLAKPSPNPHPPLIFFFFRKDLVYVVQPDPKLMVILLPQTL